MKTFGECWRQGRGWRITCKAHVSQMLKRVFGRIKGDRTDTFEIDDTPELCAELQWFQWRYPFKMETADVDYLAARAGEYEEAQERCEQVLAAEYVPREFHMAEEPRTYQKQAAELLWAVQSMLLADQLGVGKTLSAMCCFRNPETLPAVVVCASNLRFQWQRELKRFAPDLVSHIIKQKKEYDFPTRHGQIDVFIVSYAMLDAWANTLRQRCKMVVFDEVQELRHFKTDKYKAGKILADGCVYKLGMSATPVYNYGGEMFNVMNILAPGRLGTRDEFVTEWCESDGEKMILKNPQAMAAWLQDQHLMLRRTRADVGRELPPLQRITHEVECNQDALNSCESKAAELARLILSNTTTALIRGQSTMELDLLLRQWTGIGKAPAVADFVEMLVEQGEQVVLFGWHRAVYEIWMSKLKAYKPVLYTGSETALQKDAAFTKFKTGESQIMIISLRSGAGLDGIQYTGCRTVVIGELDWSPAVIDQDIGRVLRDGQTDPVVAYFLVTNGGSDPLMAELLGVKREQVDGVLGVVQNGPIVQTDHADAIRKLAQKYLDKKHGAA